MVVLGNKLIVLPPNTFFFLMALMEVIGPRNPHSGFDPAGSMSCHLKAVLTGIQVPPGALLQTDSWRRDVPPCLHNCHLLQFQSSVSRWKGP